MTYSVREIYYTLQGEGAQSGRPAVFLRFAGCNLWSGRERDRERAVCRFCDTDFVGTDGPGGGKFETPQQLAAAVAAHWHAAAGSGAPYVVCTGDELKLVYPQAEAAAQPECFTDWQFEHWFLQPMDNADKAQNTRAAIDYCLAHPQWKLSLQMHKLVGID